MRLSPKKLILVKLTLPKIIFSNTSEHLTDDGVLKNTVWEILTHAHQRAEPWGPELDRSSDQHSARMVSSPDEAAEVQRRTVGHRLQSIS